MDEEISKKIDVLESRIIEMNATVDKLRKYFLWTLIITVALFVLPLLAMGFVIPFFMNTYVSSLQGLGV
ncbi:MAG TPA: hypothetical protein VHF05_00795 [Candidatus Paceibacterota bacterium]|nr:hypothetical protein [Candidatus Paceibacterota bacterium]